MTEPSPTACFIDKPAVLIILGAVLLILPALLNGFPFIFPDSTDYLTMAPQVFRLPFYGLFITFFHWNHFIWPPVIMQCLVVSHLLWLMLNLTSGRPVARHFLPFIVVMTIFTSLPFFTGFLMADIFTPVMFLTYYILCFHHRALSGWLRYYLFLLACIATVTQIANLPLAFGLCLVLMALLVLIRMTRRARLQSLTLITMPMLLSLIAALLCNGVVFHQWTLAPAGQTFFMANMIEYGPARHYLETSCPTKHYRICKYMPLPRTANELMWIDGSVVWHLGGFMAMKPESAEIVHGTLQTYPNEVADMVVDNFYAGLKTHGPAEELYSRFIIAPFRTLVRDKFGEGDVRALDASAEARDAIPHKAILTIDSIVTPACFFLLIGVAVVTIKSRPEAFRLSVATLLFILGDVLFCTIFSGVYDRYQSRITWLMPMVLGLILVDHLKNRRVY